MVYRNIELVKRKEKKNEREKASFRYELISRKDKEKAKECGDLSSIAKTMLRQMDT